MVVEIMMKYRIYGEFYWTTKGYCLCCYCLLNILPFDKYVKGNGLNSREQTCEFRYAGYLVDRFERFRLSKI